MRSLVLAGVMMVACSVSARAEDKGTLVELAGMKSVTPAEWKEEKPSNSMRLTQFRLPKAEGDAADGELAFFSFPGKGSGTTKQNLDRQLAKFAEEGRAEKSEKAKVGDLEATYQDVTGSFKKKAFPMATDFTLVKDQRQLYVIFEGKDDKVYYATLLGGKATVEKHKKGFEEFLKNFK